MWLLPGLQCCLRSGYYLSPFRDVKYKFSAVPSLSLYHRGDDPKRPVLCTADLLVGMKVGQTELDLFACQ